MKPPVDWSPCQQKGDEHEWHIYEFWDSYNPKTWACLNCNIIVRDFNG